jgi:hypothetical protein
VVPDYHHHVGAIVAAVSLEELTVSIGDRYRWWSKVVHESDRTSLLALEFLIIYRVAQLDMIAR